MAWRLGITVFKMEWSAASTATATFSNDTPRRTCWSSFCYELQRNRFTPAMQQLACLSSAQSPPTRPVSLNERRTTRSIPLRAEESAAGGVTDRSAWMPPDPRFGWLGEQNAKCLSRP